MNAASWFIVKAGAPSALDTSGTLLRGPTQQEQSPCTRFTERFGLEHPIVCAPMDLVSTAQLARAVSRADGLGLIGGGYWDTDWLSRELAAAPGTGVGCGFITWSIDASHNDIALARDPAAILLSSGDASPYVERIHRAGTLPARSPPTPSMPTTSTTPT
jgi:NAD(P)H-dependent flavin oxidoreductase YrpB (nitropropane dioxygenase family)